MYGVWFPWVVRLIPSLVDNRTPRNGLHSNPSPCPSSTHTHKYTSPPTHTHTRTHARAHARTGAHTKTRTETRRDTRRDTTQTQHRHNTTQRMQVRKSGQPMVGGEREGVLLYLTAFGYQVFLGSRPAGPNEDSLVMIGRMSALSNFLPTCQTLPGEDALRPCRTSSTGANG